MSNIQIKNTIYIVLILNIFFKTAFVKLSRTFAVQHVTNIADMSRFYVLLLLCLCNTNTIFSQALYFPPLFGDEWATIDPADLGWCQEGIDNLDLFLEQKGSKAFIVLKDGKIVLEKYYGTFERDSVWYWASAGKSLASFLVGMAQDKELLTITDKTSDYLGKGWTSLTPDQEDQITIWHQLSMTTGLDDGVDDLDCLLPSCLEYKAPPGSRWAYHNAPYRLVQDVVASAWGGTFQNFMNTQLTLKTGISGAWFDKVMYSKPRSMARFGLLMLNKGNWNGNQILSDQQYFDAMITPSQAFNKSYGLLWWLNGQESFMLPGLQFIFNESLITEAPLDMYSALGKNDQKIYVIPSTNMVIIRMGNDGGQITGAVSSFDNALWAKINALECTSSTVEHSSFDISVSPNPFADQIQILTNQINVLHSYRLLDMQGITRQQGHMGNESAINIGPSMYPGPYMLTMYDVHGALIATKKVFCHK